MNLPSLIAGRPVAGAGTLTVRNPYDGSTVGTVALASREDTEAAIAAAVGFRETPARYARSRTLEHTANALEAAREEFARTITIETGLALRETRYEVGRTLDVLRFAAMEALRDDGQIFSCDISPQGKSRKIFTTREPLRCAAAITPFNHPLTGARRGACAASQRRGPGLHRQRPRRETHRRHRRIQEARSRTGRQ